MLDQHLVRRGEEDIEPLTGGLMGHRLRQMALADPGLSADQDVTVLAHEGTGGQVEELLTRDGRIEAKVEGLQRLGGGDAPAPHAQLQLLVGTPLDLVLQQPGEELPIGPLLGNRLLGAHLQTLQDAREAQLLERGANCCEILMAALLLPRALRLLRQR